MMMADGHHDGSGSGFRVVDITGGRVSRSSVEFVVSCLSLSIRLIVGFA